MSDPLFEHAKQVLTEILAPHGYDEFFDEVVSQKSLSLLDDDNGKRANMFGDDPKQLILEAFDKLSSTLTCHNHAPTTPPPTARRVANADDFLTLIKEYHAGGYTVRIPDVTDLSPALYRFTRALEIIIGNPVDAAIFWSEAGLAAPVHHDEYDIIAIQLVGTKKWFISSDPPSLPNKWAKIGEGPPTLERYDIWDVTPGDLLYLPRGTAHTVQSTSESIHLSIGFVPVTLRDAVLAALDHFSDLDQPMRTNAGDRADDFSVGNNSEKVVEAIQDALKKLTSNCQSDAFISNAMALRRSRMIAGLPKLPPSPVKTAIDPASRVRRNALGIAHLTTTSDIADISQPGDHILVHLGAEESLRFMTETEEFAVKDIPGEIDDDVRVALTDRLLACGFLEIPDSA